MQGNFIGATKAREEEEVTLFQTGDAESLDETFVYLGRKEKGDQRNFMVSEVERLRHHLHVQAREEESEMTPSFWT